MKHLKIKKFVELDLKCWRRSIFNFNLGITNEVDLDGYRYQLGRLSLLLSGNVEYISALFKFYIFIRESNSLFSVFMRLHLMLSNSGFKGESFSPVKIYLANNLNCKSRRH